MSRDIQEGIRVSQTAERFPRGFHAADLDPFAHRYTYSLPGGTDNNGVHVHSNHGQVAPAVAGDFLPGFECGQRVFDAHVGADVPEGDAAEEAAPDEAATAANLLGNEEGKGEHADCSGDTVDARAEEAGVGAGNAQGLEDTGRVL